MLAGSAQPVWSEARFGLVPRWARDEGIGRHTYNARSETVASKASYREAWRERRLCLVPMVCFFEPCYESGRAVRWSVSRTDGQPFAAGGLWEAWRSPGGALVHSFSLLTVNTDGHPLMGRFHAPGEEKRSAVIVPWECWRDWLGGTAARVAALLQPPAATQFRAEPAPLPGRRRPSPTPDLFGGA